MRNHAVLAAFASLLIAVAAPSAIAAAGGPPITPANGNDFVLPDGSVYQANDDGTFSLIPDVATANAMKLVWNTLQPVDEVPGPTAAPFASVVPLVNPSFNRLAGVPLTRANGNDVVLPDGSVYQGNDDGTYSWIPNLATANAMGIVWNALQPVDELPGPEGTAFPSVFG